jgi:hypothetical protein
VEEGAARGRSVSRLNVLIAITAAIIGLIYGFDLGSIASAFLFLIPAFDLSTFMTSVVTSAVVLGQLFGRSLLGASPTTAAAGPRRPARKPSERPGSDPPSRSQQVFAHVIVQVPAYAGAVQCPDHATDPAALLDAADEAMYNAKRRGKSRVFAALSLAPPPTTSGRLQQRNKGACDGDRRAAQIRFWQERRRRARRGPLWEH